MDIMTRVKLERALVAPYVGWDDPFRKPYHSWQLTRRLVVSSGELVDQAMREAELPNSGLTRSVFPDWFPRWLMHLVFSGPSAWGPGPELAALHPWAKKILSPDTLRERGMRPFIKEHAAYLMAEANSAGGTVDLARMASLMMFDTMGQLLGIEVPDEESDQILGWVDDFCSTPPLMLLRRGQLTKYFLKFVRDRRQHPQNSPVDGLIADPNLTDFQKAALVFFLFLSGVHTTSYSIPMRVGAAQTMLETEEYARLRKAIIDPNDPGHASAEAHLGLETNRLLGPSKGRPLRVTKRRMFADHWVYPGEMVYVNWVASQRDPRTIKKRVEPARFNPFLPPVGFPFGIEPRDCLGILPSMLASGELTTLIFREGLWMHDAFIEPANEFLRFKYALAA